MGQIEMEKPGASGSLLGGNQHTGRSEWQVSGEMAQRMAQLMREALMDELVKVE